MPSLLKVDTIHLSFGLSLLRYRPSASLRGFLRPLREKGLAALDVREAQLVMEM